MGLLKRWRRRRDCMHHEPVTGKTFIRSRLVDLGRKKMFWCEKCGGVWIR